MYLISPGEMSQTIRETDDFLRGGPEVPLEETPASKVINLPTRTNGLPFRNLTLLALDHVGLGECENHKEIDTQYEELSRTNKQSLRWLLKFDPCPDP
jgi:hypothetical protein